MAEEKKGFVAGFKEFIAQGNAVDLAVGVIIGAAFGKIVNALVENILNPLLGGLIGEPNFDSLGKFSIGGAEVLPGSLLTALINFLIVALVIYVFIVLPVNKMRAMAAAKKEAEPEEPSEDVKLLTEIRDALVKGDAKA